MSNVDKAITAVGVAIGLAVCSLVLQFDHEAVFARACHAVIAGLLSMSVFWLGMAAWYLYEADLIRRGRRP